MKTNRSNKAAIDKFNVFHDPETKYCDNYYCEAEAIKTVAVSVKRAGDEQRKFCGACYDAYIIGVQHGRLSENPKAYARHDSHQACSRRARKLR